MADYENQEFGVHFSVPDRLTVRQQLAYLGAVATSQAEEALERQWIAGVALLKTWQCETIPDPQADLGVVDDPRMVRIIIWVGNRIAEHVRKLEALPFPTSNAS